ncbi:hypothetical protein IWZ00DRAFT_61280 [Phyllosticta capitalensis]|uniref:Integral membrane protein n=1 Tax=Phyllosticta capitalensis TaxID=121624 RepID=A0ABR1YNP9_9PEZI
MADTVSKASPEHHPVQSLGFDDATLPFPGQLDPRAYIWIAVAGCYTTAIVVFLLILTLQRHTFAVRLRGFWLTVSAVCSLHVYLTLIFLVYAIRWWYNCAAEYWVMATLFPAGIGLWQMSNARLVYVYETQIALLKKPSYAQRRKQPFFLREPVRFLRRWKALDFQTQSTFLFVAGLSATVIISAIVFFGSRNFHENYGAFGKWSGPTKCFRGHGEWVPTTLWQFFWCWFYGPYLLYRIRNVNDAHLWAWQTRVILFFGLPGTPLWLLFLYSDNPTIENINRWFPKAGWFIPFLVAVQISALCIPIIDSFHERPGTFNVLGSSYSSFKKSPMSFSIKSSRAHSPGPSRFSDKELCSAAAMDEALEHNPRPLLDYAANRNFTAADVHFLLYVRKWKNQWSSADGQPRTLTGRQARERFEDAALIFFTFVNPTTSRATINLPDRHFKKIAKAFETLQYEADDDGNNFFTDDQMVTPWDHQKEESCRQHEIQPEDRRRLQGMLNPEDDFAENMIPAEFSLTVFDEVYRCVRDDCFHNTWCSFIRSDDFDESCRSICTKETEDSNPITPQLSYSPKHASF